MLEGLEWGTSEAVDKLKKMLWGLEALRVFDDRLSGSLSQIQKAQEAMERTVKQVRQAPHSVHSRILTYVSRKLANSTSTYFKNITMSSKSLKSDMECYRTFKSEHSLKFARSQDFEMV